jgi:hypothetical protein
MLVPAALASGVVYGQASNPTVSRPMCVPPNARETYETHATGIRILPGQWRPHYPFEQIAWISPSWPSQEYLWLDFPEAIFAADQLYFLSHVNPAVRTDLPGLAKVPWEEIPGGLQFERTLPSDVVFGGSLVMRKQATVEMEIHIRNGGDQPLKEITLQTCLYLRAIREFADYTRDNKFVHHPARGWITLTQARELPEGVGPYRIGWRTKGELLADQPIIATVSNAADRLVAMTWYSDTLSLVSNPNHPCMHADPKFKDLLPGEAGSIQGRIAFFEGPLKDFDHASILQR